MKRYILIFGLCVALCVPMAVMAADCSCEKDACACKDACVCTSCKCDKETCKPKEVKEKKAGKGKKHKNKGEKKAEVQKETFSDSSAM